MRRTTKYFFVGMGLVIAFVLIFFSASFLINVGQNQIETMLVTHVNGEPSFSNPGSESFWSSTGTYHIALIDANSYPGSPSGHTAWVNVKMAWTNTTGKPLLMIRMEYPSSGTVSPNPPKLSIPQLNDTIHNRILPMFNSTCIYPYQSCFGGFYPQSVGFFPLATGPQYVYPEQAIVILGMAPGANTDAWYAVSYKPKLVLGTTGALGTGSGGEAEMWIWSRSPTDNSSSDQYYPGITLPNGSALSSQTFDMPPHESYAIDGFTNASSFYEIGGFPNSSFFPYINNAALYSKNLSTIPGVNSLVNPYEVQAKGSAPSSPGGDWVVEFVRPLTTSRQNGESNYQLQMNQSSTNDYHISFAVSQESASQTYLIYYNSVSFWYMFNFNTNSGFNGYNNQYGSVVSGDDIGMAGAIMLFFALSYLGSKTDTAARRA